MEAAAQFHAPIPRPSRRPNRSRTSEGGGGAGADRRRPSRRGGATNRGRRRGAKHTRTATAVCDSQDLSLPPSSCAQIEIQLVPSRGCDDDLKPAQIQIVSDGGTPKRRGRRPRHFLRPCSSQSPNWGAKRARTATALNSSQDLSLIVPSRGSEDDSKSAQFQIVTEGGTSKRGRRRPHHLQRPCASPPPNWGAKRARTATGSKTSRGCDDDLNMRPCLSIQPPQNYCLGANRSRTNNSWRDWSNLDDGPAGLIAERVLAYDVADYLRFRAVCRPWRQCGTEPRSHGGLDRRFHPWRWVLLREPLAPPNRRCFLNSSTGECIQLDLPELLDHELLAITPEGLLVLLHNHNDVRLLNPLTRHLIELPPLTTLLPSKDHVLHRHFNIKEFSATGSGVASDDSTVVLCLNRHLMLGMAKPGDNHWMLLEYKTDGLTERPLMFAGCFYHVSVDGVVVLQFRPNQPPLLEVAAKLNMHVSPISESIHLFNNCGELMLMHRRIVPLTSRNKSGYRYNMYRVNLDTGTLSRVKSLGGDAERAMFFGIYCFFLLSLEFFPSGSIIADTIYPSFDFSERSQLKVGAYHLPYGRIDRPASSAGAGAGAAAIYSS